MKKQFQRSYLQRSVQAGPAETEQQESTRQTATESAPNEHTQDIHRVIANLRSARPETITAMQRTYGNRAVQRLIAGSRTGHTPGLAQTVIQRTIDDRVTLAFDKARAGKTTRELVERYMNLVPPAFQRDLLHLWSKAGKVLTGSKALEHELETLRLCLLVEAARHGIGSAFAMKKRAEKEGTNAVGVWKIKKLAAFTNSLSVDIQEDEIGECDETYEREREKLGQFTDNINKKTEQRLGAINQIVPGLEF